jgi:predicted ATP-grasp superfamily ATP-dependent carboligase
LDVLERLDPEIDATGSSLIFGILGWGHVGRISLSLLIDFLRAAKVGECLTPALPPVFLSEGNGFGKLPTLEYYFSGRHVPKVFVVTGDVMIDMTDRKHFYGTIEHIVSLAKRLGATQLITIDGRPDKDGEKIKVFASRPSVAKRAALPGAAILKMARINGYSGIAVSLSRMYGLDGIGITVPSEILTLNRSAGMLGFKYLVNLLDLRERGQ